MVQSGSLFVLRDGGCRCNSPLGLRRCVLCHRYLGCPSMTGSRTFVGSGTGLHFCVGSGGGRRIHGGGLVGRRRTTLERLIRLRTSPIGAGTICIRCYVCDNVDLSSNLSGATLVRSGRLVSFTAAGPHGFGRFMGSGGLLSGTFVRALVAENRLIHSSFGRRVDAPSKRFVKTGVGRTVDCFGGPGGTNLGAGLRGGLGLVWCE